MATEPIRLPIRQVSKEITNVGPDMLILVDDGVSMGRAKASDAIDKRAKAVAEQEIDDLNLGTASQADVEDFATAAQGAKADTALQQASNLSDLDNPDTALDNLGAGAKGAEVFKGADADEIHDALARDWSNGLADTPEAMSVPQFIGRDVVDLDTFRTTDTGDFWPLMKTLLETDNSVRTDLIRGARLMLRGGRAWRFLSRGNGYITLPQYLHMEMGPGAFIDATELTTASAPNWFTYSGHYGRPTRPVNDDYLYGTMSIPLVAGQRELLGLEIGDRLSIRATEGLTDNNVGRFTWVEDTGDTFPSSFSFYNPGSNYDVGDGVIGVAGQSAGVSYRCTVAHTAGAEINLSNFEITGTNAKQEDIYIEGFFGNTMHISAPLRYNYPQASRPIITKYEDQGSFIFRNFSVAGNDQGAPQRGRWTTATAYLAGEMVLPTGANRAWMCLTDHTSTVWADDVTAGRWRDLGSDRLLQLNKCDSVLVEGGLVERMSGYGPRFWSVADLVVRDHVGHATAKRDQPGGYLAVGEACSKGLIDNVTIRGAAQPFMLSSTGGGYGVSYGVVFRDCVAEGGASGFTQHSMHDNIVYENCEHRSINLPSSLAGVSFDIRVPSFITNCRAYNLQGRAAILRGDFMGRSSEDKTNVSTVFDGFLAHRCLTGIQVDDTVQLNADATPNGLLEIKNSRFEQIGGSGSRGAISAECTQAPGGTPMAPSRIAIRNVYVDVIGYSVAVTVRGKWQSVELDNMRWGKSGTGRSLWVYPADGTSATSPSGVYMSDLNWPSTLSRPLLSQAPTIDEGSEVYGEVADAGRSISAGDTDTQAVTVVGAAAGLGTYRPYWRAGGYSGLGLRLSAVASATHTVTVEMHNSTGSTIVIPAGTLCVRGKK